VFVEKYVTGRRILKKVYILHQDHLPIDLVMSFGPSVSVNVVISEAQRA